MLKMFSLDKLFYKVIGKFNRHFFSSTVTKVVEVDYTGYVYNLSIEDDETFFSDGVLVHNCRSTVVPEVSPDFTIAKLTGERGAKGASGRESVPGKLSYGSWLKRQPVEFVDEALGVERSRLFRSGKITIDKFTDPTGRVYTLDELKRMNNIALDE